MGLTLDMPGSNNLNRLAGAHLLAIATTARPSHDEEPIPREQMEARNKLMAEATPEEIKLILRWTMDFRSLIISLPNNKHTVWSGSIKQLLVTGSAKAKELETLIGRLGHLGMILPFVYHFSADCENGITSRRTSDTPRPCPRSATRLRADDEVP